MSAYPSAPGRADERPRRNVVALRGRSLLAADPDLASGIPEGEIALAQRCTRVAAVRIQPGPWDPAPLARAELLGVVLLRGLLLREVFVGDRVRAELLGPGDVLRPWDQEHFDALPVSYRCAWTVIEAVELAPLDDRFGRLAARWPSVMAQLMQRMAQRSQRLALQLAIGELQGVDVRLRNLLWYLAERWGRVTPEGVVVPFTLTHEMLGRLVGARRPSVTSALGVLAGEGTVHRLPEGHWLLAHQR
jgi:CRP/FNR family transcriptional regulator, cyclic AMP receptor protein